MLENSLRTAAPRGAVLDLVHRVVAGVGAVAALLGLSGTLRGTSGWMVPVLSLVLVGGVGCLWWRRTRIPSEVRASILLGALSLAVDLVLAHHGFASPAGILLVAVVVLGRILLPAAWLVWTCAANVFGFVLAAWWNMGHGSAVETALGGGDRSWSQWAGFGAAYALVAGIVLAAFDAVVSRASRGEAAERAAKERLAGILAGIHDAVFIHDPEDGGKVLELHGRIEEMYGIPPQRILDEGLGIVSADQPPWTLEEASRWIRLAMTEGPQTIPWRARRGDGSLFWVEVSIRMVKLQDLDRVLVTVRDIDRSMLDRERLISFNMELETLVQERTSEIRREREAIEEFSYMVSHDLRAPLRGIDGFALALVEDHGSVLPPVAIDLLGRIRRGAARMGELIDAFLSLARLDRRVLAPLPVDVGQLVRDVVEEVDPKGRRNEAGSVAEVEWTIGPLAPRETDPVLARQVFANLLSNAAKFARLSERPRVGVHAAARSDGEWIEISDNGPGFDPDQAERIFKPFHRLHGDSVEGVGIGLTTVRRILDRMGGAVEAEGRPGEGAVFRIRLGPARSAGTGGSA